MLTVAVHFAAPAGSIGRAVFLAAAMQVYRGERLRAASITYVVVDDPSIRRINRRFLGHDFPTDVITFPLDETPREAEIYISVDTARRQARQFRVSLREEIMRLAIHGFLHVCGYDDADEPQRARMVEAQERHLRLALQKRRKAKLT